MIFQKKRIHRLAMLVCLLALLLACACSNKPEDPKAEAPPQADVEKKADVNTIKVEHPEQFLLVAAQDMNRSLL